MRLDHLVVHVFVVMATVVSVIGVTALLLIRLDVIQGARGPFVNNDVIQQIVIIVIIIIIIIQLEGTHRVRTDAVLLLTLTLTTIFDFQPQNHTTNCRISQSHSLYEVFEHFEIIHF